MMTNPKVSLEQFASDNALRRSQECFYCEIPEREEVEKAAANGISRRIINNWLIQVVGYDKKAATDNRIDRHFQRSHHKEGRPE
jgi:hypothetical protein